MSPPRAVLLDIEGTTSPIRFVHSVLFPFARARLADYLAADPAFPERAEIARLAPGTAPLAALTRWMDEDAKVAPLKSIQGRIWAEGYASGALRSEIYPDVAPHLAAWRHAGVLLAVYSSGSVAAQRLLFGHTAQGDLAAYFADFFDTRTGPKREAASYGAIAARLGQPPGAILFLSDVEAELDAAAAAGLRACQIVRPADGTLPSARHPAAGDFAAVSAAFGLPRPA